MIVNGLLILITAKEKFTGLIGKESVTKKILIIEVLMIF